MTMPRRLIFSRRRRSLFVAVLGMGFVATSSYAALFDLSALQPSTLFIQAGVGDQSTRAYVAGATWNWDWRRRYSAMAVSGYFEADLGRWTTDDRGVSSSTWATQIGVTPVIRLQPVGAANHWFAEIGVGANYIVPLYRTGHKRFSTEFNFGDHLGIGRQFGEYRQHELMVRAQHFSNAGIEHPNPGENFVQLRYSRRF
jgi:lipid A 3-O-deacylase